jgi:hypothetical protein
MSKEARQILIATKKRKNIPLVKYLTIEDICEAMEEYAIIRLKAKEIESQKLYEWMLSDKREPAQTHFSSGVIRNISKEIEFREEMFKKSLDIK